MGFLKIVTVTTILCMEIATSAPRRPRLTLAEPMPSYYHTDIGGDSGAYSFGYDVWDPATGNTQFRSEERYPNGTVAGSYGYIDPFGESRAFKYIADERGYRVTNKRGLDRQSSGDTAAPESVPSETSITWARPSKKQSQQNKRSNVLQKRNYNDVQPPGYYILYENSV